MLNMYYTILLLSVQFQVTTSVLFYYLFLVPLFSVQGRGVRSRPSVVFLHFKPVHKKLIKYYFKGTYLCLHI